MALTYWQHEEEKALGLGIPRANSPVSVEIHRKDNEQGAERKETDKVNVHALTPCQMADIP